MTDKLKYTTGHPLPLPYRNRQRPSRHGAMKMMGVENDTHTALGMRYSAKAIMKQEFMPEKITLNDVTVVVMTFLDAVTADGKPQYQPDLFMKQSALLAQWRADKLDEIM